MANIMALDIATNTGVAWNVGQKIYCQRITGGPRFLYENILEIVQRHKIKRGVFEANVVMGRGKGKGAGQHYTLWLLAEMAAAIRYPIYWKTGIRIEGVKMSSAYTFLRDNNEIKTVPTSKRKEAIFTALSKKAKNSREVVLEILHKDYPDATKIAGRTTYKLDGKFDTDVEVPPLLTDDHTDALALLFKELNDIREYALLPNIKSADTKAERLLTGLEW